MRNTEETMKFRQRNKNNNKQEWSDWRELLDFSVDDSTITFTCKWTEHLGAFPMARTNYTLLKSWIESSRIENNIARIDSRYLFIEIIGEVDDSINLLQELIVSIAPNNAKEHKASIAGNSVSDILDEMDKLIGLRSIKVEVRSIINMIQVQQLRAEKGLKKLDVSNHMVFYGNPGTGKTTIARRLGDIYRILGLLSKGHFIETDRSGLVAGYLGQTALKTTEVLDSALGGILFIDEAYSLANEDGQDQYGQEAVDTILKYMEDHRDDLVVIVAGYKDLMLRFLGSNPGLKSRFNKYLDFPDYCGEELALIFCSMVAESHYIMTEDATEHLLNLCRELSDIKTENFGNGRAMRNLFEKTISNQANRIMSRALLSEQELQTIEVQDIIRDDMLSVR